MDVYNPLPDLPRQLVGKEFFSPPAGGEIRKGVRNFKITLNHKNEG